ncbi:MAG: ABC transporter permease [archaeon]
MRFLSIVKKNFKLLIRSKSSAFIVFIGPLLIIALVGLIFSGKTSYDLNIGYFAPASTNMTVSFISALEGNHYLVRSFASEEACSDRIKQGIIHTCIIFPVDFEMNSTRSNELIFLVDYSRINLVYKVIDAVSGVLELESKEISYSLTKLMLSKINSTVAELSNDIAALDKTISELNSLAQDIASSRTASGSMKFNVEAISLEGLRSHVAVLNQTINSTIEKSLLVVDQGNDFISMIRTSDYLNDSEVLELQGDFDELASDMAELQNITLKRLEALLSDITGIEASFSTVQAELDASSKLNQEVQSRLDSAAKSISALQASASVLKRSLESTRKNLESVSLGRAESIVSPVNTKIEPVSSDSSNMTFTFPFLLVMIIMFVALLLSSTLVIFEKNTKAYFRNFMTPTRPWLFIISSFVTVAIIIILQTLVILSISQQIFGLSLFANIWPTLTILFAAAAFFIVVGMLIGYSFSTQEGAVMLSVVLGSLFLFVSNLVVPLESIAPAFANIIRYNPYILFSEMLRKSLLFKTGLAESMAILLALGAVALLMLVIILVGQGLAKRRKPRVAVAAAAKPGSSSDAQSAKGYLPDGESIGTGVLFEIGDKKAATKEELLKIIVDATRSEFESCVNAHENKMADWLESTGERRLAAKVRKAGDDRKEVIRVLAENIGSTRKAAEDEQ